MRRSGWGQRMLQTHKQVDRIDLQMQYVVSQAHTPMVLALLQYPIFTCSASVEKLQVQYVQYTGSCGGIQALHYSSSVCSGISQIRLGTHVIVPQISKPFSATPTSEVVNIQLVTFNHTYMPYNRDFDESTRVNRQVLQSRVATSSMLVQTPET